MAAGEEAAAFLDRELRSFGPDVRVTSKKNLRQYARGGAPFALVRVLKTRADVAFSRLGRARSKRILDARAAGLAGFRHRVVLEAPGDVDSELLAWLREGYELAESPPQ